MDCIASGIMDRTNYAGEQAELRRFCSKTWAKKENDNADRCLFLRELNAGPLVHFNWGVLL